MIKDIKNRKEFYSKVASRVNSKLKHIPETSFIAENAIIIGEVSIGDYSSIWYNCVLRGDVNDIKIGSKTNIQDGTIIHVSSTLQGTYIGSSVTVGHSALLHACSIEDNTFIGMQACVMDGARVEKYAMVAAGALVTPNKIIGSGELWAGRPAKFVRKLTDVAIKEIEASSKHYVELSKIYLEK